MGILDVGAGAGEGLEQLLARHRAEEMLANQTRAQQESTRSNRADESYRDRALTESTKQRELVQHDRTAAAGLVEQNRLRDDVRAKYSTLPMSTIMDPATVQRDIASGGVAKERFEGGTIPDREAVSTGVPESLAQNESVIKLRGTSTEIGAKADREAIIEDRTERSLDRDEDRAARTAEAASRNADRDADRNRPARGTLQIVMGNEGPMVVDKGSRTARPVTMGDSGDQMPLPPTTDTRNRTAAMKRVQPMMDAINELSPVINTKPGIQAVFAGGWRALKAKAQEDDDVGEYVAVVEAFTPLLARAEGHVGVLTEKDFEHAMAILPLPGNSASMAKRKIARMEKIFGLTGSAPASGAGTTPTGAPGAPGATSTGKKIGRFEIIE